MSNLLSLKIISPTQLIYSGQAKVVSSVNSDGKFDVMPEHANFITLIEQHPIKVITEQNETLNFQFSQALLYVSGNKVSIYAEPTLGKTS